MTRKIQSIIAAMALISLAGGCSKPEPHKIDQLGVTIDLPSGWKAATDTYGKRVVAELSAGGRRVVAIEEESTVIESMDMLVKAMSKDHKVIAKESTKSGFGGTFEKGGKKTFIYVAKLNGKSYRCHRGPYFKVKYLEKAITVCKSLRL